MSYRNFVCLLALLPVLGWAQVPAPLTVSSSNSGATLRSTHSVREVENDRDNTVRWEEGLTPETRTVLLANCPKDMAQADWLRLMENPVSRSLYPLRISQALLDTLDGSKLDLRFQYVLVPEVERR